MTKLFITRHGETLWNLEKRLQGWSNSPLSELGINQAKWLSERLKDQPIDIIYSSPLERAYNTACIIRGDRDIEIIKSDAFKEIDTGEWTGKSYDEMQALGIEEVNNFYNFPHLYKSKIGEDYYQVKERTHKGLKEVLAKHKGENILIVTHGVALKVMMMYFEEKPMEKLWDLPYIYQTSLTEIDIEEDNYNIKLYADTSHYKEHIEA